MNSIIQAIAGLAALSSSLAAAPVKSAHTAPKTVDICATSGKFLVKKSKPTVTVIYTEPSTTVDDKPLTALGKTVIYYDLGEGLVRAKEVPASKPTGGGEVSETIMIPLGVSAEKMVTICVAAENEAPRPPNNDERSWKGVPWR